MATESNTYNDYSAATTENYPLISNFSHWLQPERVRELYDVNPLETDWGDFMKMGLMKEVTAEEIFHREKNSRFDVGIVNTSATQANVYGTASEGNGDPATESGKLYIQLATESHTPTSGPNPYKYSYPRVGEHIKFPNLAEFRIHGKRTSVDGAHRLYLQQVDSSGPSLAATITNAGGTYGGNTFIVIGPSFEESTLGQTTGLVPTHKVYQSYLQRFGDYYAVTNFMENTKTYPITWKGSPIDFHYEIGINDMEINLAAKIDHSLFLGAKDTTGNLTSLDPETGVEGAVSTTQSYLANLELNADKLYYDTISTVALFDQINRKRRQLQQGLNVLMWVGSEFMTKIESVVTQLGVNGGMIYDRQAVDLDISQIKKGGAVYNIKMMKILNHPKFGGAPGFDYPHQFIIAPTLKISGSMDGRSGSGDMLDAVQIIYKKQVGIGARGHYKIWETGANARQTGGQNKRRNREINIDVNCGMMTVGGTKHIYGKPSGL